MKTHKFGHWRYLLLNGREKKKLEFPSRERSLVRTALQRLGLRYRETVPFLNPLYKGWKGQVDAAIQWLDFAVWLDGRMVVLMFHPKHKTGGMKKHEKVSWQAKLRFLEEKGITYRVLTRSDTSQIYEFIIRTMKKRKENKS